MVNCNSSQDDTKKNKQRIIVFDSQQNLMCQIKENFAINSGSAIMNDTELLLCQCFHIL